VEAALAALTTPYDMTGPAVEEPTSLKGTS